MLLFPFTNEYPYFKFLIYNMQKRVRKSIVYIVIVISLRSYTADERTKRYEMAVAMVILGVRYTLDQLSEEFISEKGDVIDQVVKKSAFLKLTKNPNPAVSFSHLKLTI